TTRGNRGIGVQQVDVVYAILWREAERLHPPLVFMRTGIRCKKRTIRYVKAHLQHASFLIAVKIPDHLPCSIQVHCFQSRPRIVAEEEAGIAIANSGSRIQAVGGIGIDSRLISAQKKFGSFCLTRICMGLYPTHYFV